MRTNTLGPALLTQACIAFLDKGKEKKVVNISSTLGSVASADQFGHLGPGGAASYSISKAALNMFVRSSHTRAAIRPSLTNESSPFSDVQAEARAARPDRYHDVSWMSTLR